MVQFKFVRLYSDELGDSHFDEQRLAMTLADFAPPAPPLAVSARQEASGFVVIQLPVAWCGDEPHPSPSRQMVYCLSGNFRITATDGETRSFGPGDALMLTDTTGNGHVTEVTSSVPVNCVMIAIA
jgi:hypothetical protein